MLNKLRVLFVLFLAIGMGACQTIELVNDRNDGENGEIDWAWNHTGIFGLVNYSDDFAIQTMCGNKGWKWVSSDLSKGPLGVEIAIFVASSIPAAASAGSLASFAYSPRAVSWQCAN